MFLEVDADFSKTWKPMDSLGKSCPPSPGTGVQSGEEDLMAKIQGL